MQKYAVDTKVDMVLLGGDIFDQRIPSVQGMNHAVDCLKLLQQHKIPCIGISGNHDAKEASSDFSFLRSLSAWGFLKLLEPVYEKDSAKLVEWDDNKRTGSFINICGIRVYGSIWWGSSTSDNLTRLMDMVRDVHDSSVYNVLLLHAEIEGMLNSHIKGVSVEKVKELKKYFNYIALGHIHKNFEIDSLLYNPGSVESCNVEEYFYKHGVYLVEVDIKNKTHKAILKENYYRRPIIRLIFEVLESFSPEEFKTNLFNYLNKELISQTNENKDLAPVIELRLQGKLGFKTNLLDLNKIREKIKKDYHSLLVLIKNETLPLDFAIEACDTLTRGEKERKILVDLISKDKRFESKSDKFTDLLLEAKRLALFGEDPSKIADLIERNV